MEAPAAKKRPQKSMKQVHIFIFGFVQGVGFRQFIKTKAKEFSLTGWVRNLPDGSVEAVFQGDKASIEKIIKLCRKGPFLSEVENVDIKWENIVDNLSEFMVL